MKHIAVCIAAVVAVATPAIAQQGTPAPNQPNAASAPSRAEIAGRFSLDIANEDQGFVDRIDEEPSDESNEPALNDEATTQARSAAPQAQLPTPQTVTQSRQVQTQPRIRPNP